MIDILYLASNRLAFTKESFLSTAANTNWSLVSRVIVYDDGSVDGTREMLAALLELVPVPFELRTTQLGGPVAIMNDYLWSCRVDAEAPPVFCKLDNDVIVPPGWLDPCITVMTENPQLDLLGIEPLASRTGSPQRSHRNGGRIYERSDEAKPGPPRFVVCDSIGGVGLMRRAAFDKREAMQPYATYGGFTTWQIDHKDLVKGWIAPALKMFLLDRIPFAPWKALSLEYIKRGWQRPWTDYTESDAADLWEWWTPTEALCSR